jgi:hypothetical protein
VGILGLLAVGLLVITLVSGGKGKKRIVIPSSTAPVTNVAVGAPTGLAATDHGAEMSLSWQDHTNGQASYVVLVVPPGQAAQPHVVPHGQTTYVVGGLQPSVPYCFRVDTILSSASVAPADVCPRGGQLVEQSPGSTPPSSKAP